MPTPDKTQRSRSDLLAYARDLSGTRDARLDANLTALIAGDETKRKAVESALNQIDQDAARHE